MLQGKHAVVFGASGSTGSAVAVSGYIDDVVAHSGSMDIALNVTGPRAAEYGYGKPAVELSINEFMLPVSTVLKSNFITARAAGAPHGRAARVEDLRENLAIEVGPSGVRIVWLRTLADTAKAAVFLASDHACMMTGTVLNATADAAMAE
jgi:hypothetical protein